MAAPPFIQRGALCDFNITDQVRLATAPVRFGFAAKTNSYPSIPRGFDGFALYRRVADWRYRADLCHVEIHVDETICRCRLALLYAALKLEDTARVVLGVLPEF